MFIDFFVALLFVVSSLTFRKWRCCSTCRKWRLIQTPVTSNVLYRSLWRMGEGDNGKRSQATAEGVCVEGAVSCSTLRRWARRLFVKGRHDDVAVHTQHRQTNADVERVKCDCGR
jgi:hypothetical protein